MKTMLGRLGLGSAATPLAIRPSCKPQANATLMVLIFMVQR